MREEIKYIKYRGLMRGRIANIQSHHGWAVGLECAEQVLELICGELRGVENPSDKASPLYEVFTIGFENFRHKAITLLEGGKK